MSTQHALLIDDDRHWHTVCKTLCEDFNYDCTWASTLREAREHLNKRKVDTIILDLGFPEGQNDLLPPDVKEIDLVLAGLESSPRPLSVLICTAMNDPVKLALVERSLVAAKHKVRVFQKGGEMSALYRNFSEITGRLQRSSPSPSGGRLTVSFALLALVVAFILGVMTVFVAPMFLSAQPGQTYGKLLSFVLVSAVLFFGLLILWGTGMINRQHVWELIKRGCEFAGRVFSESGSSGTRSGKATDDKGKDKT